MSVHLPQGTWEPGDWTRTGCQECPLQGGPRVLHSPITPRPPRLCQQPVHTGSPGTPAHPSPRALGGHHQPLGPHPRRGPCLVLPNSPPRSEPHSRALLLSCPSVTVSHCVVLGHRRSSLKNTRNLQRRLNRSLWFFCPGGRNSPSQTCPDASDQLRAVPGRAGAPMDQPEKQGPASLASTWPRPQPYPDLSCWPLPPP